MVKKSKVPKLNAVTEMAKNDKNLGPTSETPKLVLDRVPASVISKKSSNNKSANLRRSWRLQSVIKPVKNQEIEQVNLLESEKEDEPLVEDNEKENESLTLIEDNTKEHPLASEPHNNDRPATNHKTLDEVYDDQMKAVPKGAKEHDSRESSLVSVMYKSLYFDSQRKVEALTLENQELAKRLEVALGKLEVYESVYKSTQEVTILNVVKGGDVDGACPPSGGVVANGDVDGGYASNRGVRRHRQPNK